MTATRTRSVRAPAWTQYIDQPEEWAIEHRWLLEAAFEAFDRTGEWPLIEEVQLALAETNPDHAVAVSQLMIDIPSSLGARHSQRVELTVRALSYCPAAAELLDRFLAAMKRAASLYPGDGHDSSPALRGSDVKTEFALNDLEYRKVSTLIFSEGWFFNGGFGGVDGDWTRSIRAEILLVKQVQNVGDYLDAVARYRFGPPEVEIEEEAPATRTRPRRGWRKWYRGHRTDILVAVGILSLIAVIAGVVLPLTLGDGGGSGAARGPNSAAATGATTAPQVYASLEPGPNGGDSQLVDGKPVTYIDLHNNSGSPVFKAIVSFVFVQGAAWHTGQELARNVQLAQEFQRAVQEIPTGRSRIQVYGQWGIPGGRPGVEIAYQDETGHSWVRFSDGRVYALSTDPPT